MSDAFRAGQDFLLREARLLERRLFATLFLGADSRGVVDALRGYQNDDGGFGHGLEPDKRCPASLPLDVEVALQALNAAGAFDETMLMQTCDFLGRIAEEADAGGAVPLVSPGIESFPRAEHWAEWAYVPGLNPTAGLAGLLYALNVDHQWLAEATQYCWAALDDAKAIEEVHTLSEVFVFLEHVPEREKAEARATALAEQFSKVPGLRVDPEAPGYGLTPLNFAPEASSRWLKLFSQRQIDAHLDHLQGEQQADGGWPLRWEPPSAASALEWRGMETLRALRTLSSYGRLAPPSA